MNVKGIESMKKILVLLVAGSVLSGVAAYAAIAKPAIAKPGTIARRG